MKTSFSLLAALTPAVPGGEILPPAPNHSPDPLAASDSFFKVMSQVRGDGFPKPSAEPKTAAAAVSLTETAPAPASPSENEAATLIALMVRSHFGGEQLVNLKNTPDRHIAPQSPAKPSSTGAPAAKPPALPATLQDKTRPAQTAQPQIRFRELREPAPAPAAQGGRILTPKTSANTGAVTVVSLKSAADIFSNVNTKRSPVIGEVKAPSVARSSGSVAPATETAGRAAVVPARTASLPIAVPPPPPFVADSKPVPVRGALQPGALKTAAARLPAAATELPLPPSAPPVNPKITRAANQGGKFPLIPPQVAAAEMRQPALEQTVNSKAGTVTPENPASFPANSPGGEKPAPQPASGRIVNPKVAPAALETPAPFPVNSPGNDQPALIRPQAAAGELRQPAPAQTVNHKGAPVALETPAPVLTKPPGGGRPVAIQPPVAPVDARIAPDARKSATQSFAESSGNGQLAVIDPQAATVPARIAPDSAAPPQITIVDTTATAPSSSDAPPAAAPVTPVDADPSIAGIMAAMADQPVPAAGPLRPPAPARTVNIKIDASLTPAPKAVAALPEEPVPQTKVTEDSRDSASAQPAPVKIAPENNAPPVAAHPSSDSKPERSKPAQQAIDPARSEKPAFTKDEPAGSAPPPAGAPIAVTAPAGPNPTAPADGTGGALNSQRMSFTGEKNEIAGPAAQKVPGASAADDFGPKALNDLAGGSTSDHSGQRQNSPDSTPLMDFPGKAGEFNVDAARGTAAVAPVDHAATMVERVGHLVDQQVVMLRQSGAHNVAVSLKLDPRTELSLQLTNHNGQIEASVRWERGAVAGLDSHWHDLQESLARQNVQLLPLENKPVSRPPSFNSPSGTESGSSSRQSPQNPRRQNAGTRQDAPLAAGGGTVPATQQTTTRTASRQGWESWA